MVHEHDNFQAMILIDIYGVVFVDIDECAEESDPCSDGCENEEGSFTCTCPTGKKIGSDFKTCQGDVKEGGGDGC